MWHLLSQVLNVSPEHPAVMLSLRQVQCQRLLLADGGTALPDSVLEQLNNTVMMNPTNLGAWHVSGRSIISIPYHSLCCRTFFSFISSTGCLMAQQSKQRYTTLFTETYSTKLYYKARLENIVGLSLGLSVV